MVAVEYSDVPKFFHVAVRKNGLDPDSPRWQRLYFRFIYRPFLRFSFKVFCIPPPHKMNADGSFSFLEGIAIATDQETAESMCKDEFYRVAPLPVNNPLPRQSIQYGVHTYPKSPMPDRYHSRIFPGVKSIAELNTEELMVEEMNAQLDRMNARVRSSPPT